VIGSNECRLIYEDFSLFGVFECKKGKLYAEIWVGKDKLQCEGQGGGLDVGEVRDRNILSELALVLGLDERTLVLKLLTINALLLEKSRKEGVSPEEFFEGCLYVPKSVREKLGEDWEEGF